MKTTKDNSLVNEFLAGCMDSWEPEEIVDAALVEHLLTGIMVQNKPTPNKIHDEGSSGPSKRAYYRHIHALAPKMPDALRRVIVNVQQDPKLAIKPGGVLSLDEHIVPHSSKEMEGVSPMFSTAERGVILGLSLIAVHYFHKRVEYPVDFENYRRFEELQQWGKDAEYREKNEIARGLIERISAFPNAPSTWLMDSFFMTKKNVRLLRHLLKDYISRPKRNWTCTYNKKHYSFGELFDTIPAEEFVKTLVKNPKTGRVKEYYTATRNVFIPGIGTHLVVFIWCKGKGEQNDVIEETPEIFDAPSKCKFRLFITDRTDWDAATVLSLYSLRWTIETCFRDLSQNLGLHGCKWRQLDGQRCFVALAFLCYLFLAWAQAHGRLVRYRPEKGTLGQKRQAFEHYCQEEFSNWFAEIKRQGEDCALALWFYNHVFGGGMEE